MVHRSVAAETVSETALATIAPAVDPRLAGAPFDTTTTTTPGGGEVRSVRQCARNIATDWMMQNRHPAWWPRVKRGLSG